MHLRASMRLIPTLVLSLICPSLCIAQGEYLPLDDFVSEDGLDGDAIYDRMLQNRFNSYEQRLRMVSGDKGGNTHDVHIRVRYKNYREQSKQIVSKTIAKYFAPPDVRHLGYLVVNKLDGPDDQFVYLPSTRKVRRINVRREAIAGTDFAFEDIIPQEFEDGTHHRLPDALVDGTDTYVVVVVPRPQTDSEYSKFVLYIEKEHYVPIQTVYWDNKRVKIKQLRAKPESITLYQDEEDGKPKQVWIANETRMAHLKLESFTVLEIQELEANPRLRERDFSERELTASR